MKPSFLTYLAVSLLALGSSLAQETDTYMLVSVLQSSKAAQDKADACRQLKRVGTVAAVPALAALLGEEQLCQSACDALQTMPYPAAGQALRRALQSVPPANLTPVIHAIGERRDEAAVPELTGFLSAKEPLTAQAACRALGEIGGPGVVESLQRNLKTAHEPIRAAMVDALLHCASQLNATGGPKAASRIFASLDRPDESETVRAAAYAGRIRSAGERSLTLLVAGITSDDPAHQIAALKLAQDEADPKTTAAFTNLLTRSKPALQAALIALLQQRGDSAAVPAIQTLARNPDHYVRETALTALGILGDARLIPFLLDAATSGDESQQKIAQQALIELRHGPVAESLVAQLTTAPASAQPILAAALAGRAEKSAVPRLLELARSEHEVTRKAAFRALSPLVDGSHLARLIQLLQQMPTEAGQSEVRDLVEALVNRADPHKQFDVGPLRSALEGSTGATRLMLFRVGALFADKNLRPIWVKALQYPDLAFRNHVARALCTTRDAGLCGELLDLAGHADDANLRALALEGYVRLAVDENLAASAEQRAALLQIAFNAASRPEDKRLVLSASAGIPHRDALALADRALGETELRAEAELAVAKIAKGLLDSDAAPALAALQRLIESSPSEATKATAQAALKEYRTKHPAPQ